MQRPAEARPHLEEFENPFSFQREGEVSRTEKSSAKIDSYLISLKNKLQEHYNIKYKSILFFNTRNNLMKYKIDSEYGFLGVGPAGIDYEIECLGADKMNSE